MREVVITAYEDMDAAQLRDELRDWTHRTVQWADDIAEALAVADYARAGGLLHAYSQARHQMRRIERILTLGIAA